jgi:hypothetical protein
MSPEKTGAPGESQYGSVKVIAKLLGVSESYLNKGRLSGDGPPYVKFGHNVRYHVQTVLNWAAAQARRSTSEHSAA